ncbi:hypothetical protein AbraIFM66951_001081 [Aspergillus brasiliensis]|uniref:Uncharacterized protein n=1 Tax=Aspergillus brasiliensis TaxID=319629 RepID=A0A9W6DJJ7_9EURO|nr:hypothetical protein AbraCBS73388_010114 [Aspergillus brasiliensis]GKZ48839.1 hypothetical protein AbraIFM66951_001081 [Aspergillus brasiliensis]
MASNTSVDSELRSQWTNPAGVMSLLMLVGGDIVQRALAQLFGVRFRFLPGILEHPFCLYLTPVAFSFGWVAYAFSSLATIFGDCRLMPSPDIAAQVINLSNGYVRENNSWVLGHLLRYYEASVADMDRSSGTSNMAPLGSTGKVSLKIDIFVADAVDDKGPGISWTWCFCWIAIIVQNVIAAIPWIVNGDWGIFLVTISGTLFAVVTGSLPQWAAEKWPAPKLWKSKTVALTRGNGHQYVMVVESHQGAWDLEAMSSSRPYVRLETFWVLLTLTILWSLLLITVSGLNDHPWYLVGVGGLGMLQNIWFSSAIINPKAANLKLRKYRRRPTITGYQQTSEAKTRMKQNDPTDSDTDTDLGPVVAEDGVRDVMGGLMELEKLLPKAGIALLPVFFPGRVEYDQGLLYSNRERKFWKCASASAKSRKERQDP